MRRNLIRNLTPSTSSTSITAYNATGDLIDETPNEPEHCITGERNITYME